MYYVKNVYGDWLLAQSRWYHGRPTFTNTLSDADQFTEGEADAVLQHPGMPAGAYKELVA